MLKGSYDVAKNNIILCIWYNAMRLCGLRLLFSTYCTLLLLRLSEPSIFTKLIVLRSEACSDWPAIQCPVIGRIPQAWDWKVTPLTVLWCRVRRDDTKTKPIINEAFVASSRDIITDYNDLSPVHTASDTERHDPIHFQWRACDKSDSDRWWRNVGVSSDAGQAAKVKDCSTLCKWTVNFASDSQ